jgi:hypothetical protein
MSSRNNDRTLKDAIKELLEVYKLSGRLNEIDVVNAWPRLVGPALARYTKNIYVHRRILYVELDSSVVRNELSMAKSALLKALNKGYEHPVIDDIIFK